jgi:hypothetical protein
MPVTIKKNSHLDFVIQSAKDTTAFGGAAVADAIARDSGLWLNFAEAAPQLEHRRDTSRGCRPDAIIAQILTSFVTGGINVADAGRVDEALAKLVGLPAVADQTTLCKWFNAQSEESVARVWDINRKFLDWTFRQLPPDQLRDQNGKLSVFFDDTNIEVEGHHFQDAKLNYNGDIAYSFQAVWLGGRWLAAGKLDSGNIDCSSHMKELLLDSKALWHPHAEQGLAHFYADSGSSAGKYLTFVNQYNWSWTISYNKWTTVLETQAVAEPDTQWGAAQNGRVRGGKDVKEEFTWLRHQPGEDCLTGHDFATLRYKALDGGDMFYRYAYVACGQPNKASAPITKAEGARDTFAIHRQKGEFENCFSNLLGDLDLHHPPFSSKAANAMWFALGALANNLLRAMQVLTMPEEEQNARLRSIIRYWVTTPAKLTVHAGRRSIKVYVPAALKRHWAELLAKVWPKRQRGGQIRNLPPGHNDPWKVKATGTGKQKPTKGGA